MFLHCPWLKQAAKDAGAEEVDPSAMEAKKPSQNAFQVRWASFTRDGGEKLITQNVMIILIVSYDSWANFDKLK